MTRSTPPYVAAVDQGTTSSRCIIFDASGATIASAQKEHRQIYPQPGWVEHDAAEIWRNVQQVIAGALERAEIAPSALAAVGVTNQRETTVLWDRRTGHPVTGAIVWQDTRTDRLVRDLGGVVGADRFREICGLPLATYFSGPKIRWLLDKHDLHAAATRGDVLFGTMDSWLIWNLTGQHVTDVTNASRTMLMNLATLDWDEGMLSVMGVPRAMLPEIRSSSEVYGAGRGVLEGVAIAGALGDQQAALFGQACFAPGEGKCTYGTGAFLLMNTGAAPVHSDRGLITTVGYKIGDAPAAYVLEGSIAVAGSLVQWVRDNLGLIRSSAEIETLAASVADSGGCVIVPAFAGLFAPRWRADARGVIAGLTGYVTKAHIARAVLEAAAWQVREVADAMEADAGKPLTMLKADGGMAANNLLMQFQADVLNTPVERPAELETTCLGAAYAAGLAVGYWPDTETLRKNWRQGAEWRPKMSAEDRDAGYARWNKAVERTLGWIEG